MKTNSKDRPEERPNPAQEPSDSDSLVTEIYNTQIDNLMRRIDPPTDGGPGSGPPEPYWENLLKFAAKQEVKLPSSPVRGDQ